MGGGLVITGIAMFFSNKTAGYAPVLLSAGLGAFGYKGYKELYSSEKPSPDLKKIE